jgi:regulator of protease activity HflC (stomatin/prohibitin superfamily)
MGGTILLGLVALIGAIALIRSIRIIPAQTASVVERLGKYSKTLEAGFHILIPFIDRVKYKHSLKEIAVDVPAQQCFTLDNVSVTIDGVLYMKVMDPIRASYGINDYLYATIQLAQTTMRSVIGRLELDRTFEEREAMNAEVVKYVDEASDPWGIQVSRYEIQNITVNSAILQAMEVQMKAEREKRAQIARSQGVMSSQINRSLAAMEEMTNKSEGEMAKRINEAEGYAAEIRSISHATAEGIKLIADAISESGGTEAVTLQLADRYITQLGNMAKSSTEVILPANLTDVSGFLETISKIVEDKD